MYMLSRETSGLHRRTLCSFLFYRPFCAALYVDWHTSRFSSQRGGIGSLLPVSESSESSILARYCGCRASYHRILSCLASITVSEKGGGEGAPRVPNDPAAAKLDPEPREHVLSDQIRVLGQQFQRGQRLGRPRQLSEEVVTRIARERAQGRTLGAIADRLNADNVLTALGWRGGTARNGSRRTPVHRVGPAG